MRRSAIAISTALFAVPALVAGAAQAQDRYGPQASGDLTPVSYAADRPMLTWPGKQPAPSDQPAAPPEVAPATQPAPPPASIYTPPPELAAPPQAPMPAPPPAPAPVMIAPQASLRAPPPPTPPTPSASLDMRPMLAVTPTPAPAVTHAPVAPSPQIVRAAKPKTPQPAAKPPVAVAEAAPAPTAAEPAEPPHKPWSATGPGLPAHFYSTAREFGLQPDPDPVPLSPQFFADSGSADLAAPPPPLSPHAVPGSQTVDSSASANTPANRARAIALDTPSPDGSGN